MLYDDDWREPSLRRGLSLQQAQKIVTRPLWALRNAKFQRASTISEQRHVFVVGPPRSGTTLMMALLCAHPRLAGLDAETKFFFRRNFLDLNLDAVPRKEMTGLLRAARDKVDLFDRIGAFVKTQYGATRFVEKTPKHALRLDFLGRHYPNAHFVFMIRDPRDGYLSVTHKGGIWQSTVPRYTELWRRSLNAYYAAKTSAVSIVLVRYEDLCRTPEAELSRVMAFLGEAFDAAQLDREVYGNTRMRLRQGLERVAQDISSSSIGGWKRMLDRESARDIEKELCSEMRELGYLMEANK